MARPTMPLPRIPELSLPSFRELDESVEANRCNQPSSHLSNNMYDGTGKSSSSSPQKINTPPNPYPPYPANGWLVPPDPSQNASVGVLQPSLNVDRGKERTRSCISGQKRSSQDHPIEVHRNSQLPLRLKETQPSPTSTQSTLSSVQSTLRGPLSPSTQVSSTPENISPNQTRPIATNRPPQNEQVRRQRVNRDLAANHRAQRRRVGVHFSEVAAHTAKCDVCNKRNKNGMSRCQNCGWQICRKCLTDRSGDRTHASFGATHVPEGGGDMPVSLPSVDRNQDRNQDRRGAGSIAEVRAAQTLLDLGSFASGTANTTDNVKGNAGGQKVVPTRGRILQQVDALSTDSDMTLSVVGDEDWLQGEPDVPIGEDGLPVGYIITRRNPARAARPSTKMAE
ncbi:unnamed protein product [Penicillium glandicola]